MKKTILFLIIAFQCVASSATPISMDTIYYDKEWKGVSNPHFATYYRIIEKNPNSNYRKLLRDYYITGELQNESGYISIDKYDDSKSILDGEWNSYYKSGKIEQKGRRVNGKEQGEYIRFFENGSIAIRTNMLDDQNHGLYTEFDENGVCSQQEFSHGKPRNDYYVVTNDAGLYSKVRISDNTPIYSSPSLDTKKVEYRDGEAWSYYINDGILIALTSSVTSDYGKYYRIHINFTNNSFYPIDFNPSDVTAILIDNKGKEIALEQQTATQYDNRIKRTQMWEEALVGLANGLAASDAGYSTSTTTTTYNNRSNSRSDARASGSGGYAYGSHSGSSNSYGSIKSTTHTYDAMAAYQAQLIASQNMAAFSEHDFQIRKARNEGYLKRTTINPGESINGYFNLKHKKGNSLMITLKICGIAYQFPCDISHSK